MKMLSAVFQAVCLGALVVLAFLCAGRVESQDPGLKAKSSNKCSADFSDITKTFTAGGNTRTNKGGVSAYVANRPDYDFHYTPNSTHALTFRATRTKDGEAITLLINLPDETWRAVVSTNGLAEIRFPRPQKGLYNVWLGTVGEDPIKNVALTVFDRER